MTLEQIAQALSAPEDAPRLLRRCGMHESALRLPRRYDRAMAYYRRALRLAPMQALADDMRDHRFDPAILEAQARRTGFSDEQIERCCANYRARAERAHIAALARRVASRLKQMEGRARGDQP